MKINQGIWTTGLHRLRIEPLLDRVFWFRSRADFLGKTVEMQSILSAVSQ
jgi:hypothetical protein